MYEASQRLLEVGDSDDENLESESSGDGVDQLEVNQIDLKMKGEALRSGKEEQRRKDRGK